MGGETKDWISVCIFLLGDIMTAVILFQFHCGVEFEVRILQPVLSILGEGTAVVEIGIPVENVVLRQIVQIAVGNGDGYLSRGDYTALLVVSSCQIRLVGSAILAEYNRGLDELAGNLLGFHLNHNLARCRVHVLVCAHHASIFISDWNLFVLALHLQLDFD